MALKNACRNCKTYYPNVTNGKCPKCMGLLRDINQTQWDNYVCDTRSVAAPIPDTDSLHPTENPYHPPVEPSPPQYPFGSTRRNDSYCPDPHGAGNRQPSHKKDPFYPGDKSDYMTDNSRRGFRSSRHGRGQRHQDRLQNRKNIKRYGEGFFCKDYITGTLIKVSQQQDHRLIITQLFSGLVYGQPFGDDVYQFIIRDDNGVTHYANAYGEISGGSAAPVENTEVTVSGRYNLNRTLMIRSMHVVNGPSIRFKTSGEVVHRILRFAWVPLLLVALFAAGYFVYNNFTAIKQFAAAMAIIYGFAVAVCYCFITAIRPRWRFGTRIRLSALLCLILLVVLIVYVILKI